MSSIRKPCTNYPNATYTGKEQSPLRFGLSAEGYTRYTTMEGFDKLLWMVDIKNNKKVWVRKTTDHKLTHEEPIITSNNDVNVILNTNDNNIYVNNVNIQINNEVLSQEQNIPQKKITDYNIFLSYKLKLLKDEFKDSKTENKDLFKMAMDDWKRIKNNQNELKEFILKAKQDVTFNSSETSKKKKSNNNPVILKDIVVERDSDINNNHNKDLTVKEEKTTSDINCNIDTKDKKTKTVNKKKIKEEKQVVNDVPKEIVNETSKEEKKVVEEKEITNEDPSKEEKEVINEVINDVVNEVSKEDAKDKKQKNNKKSNIVKKTVQFEKTNDDDKHNDIKIKKPRTKKVSTISE